MSGQGEATLILGLVLNAGLRPSETAAPGSPSTTSRTGWWPSSRGTVESPADTERHRPRAFRLVAKTRELGRDPEMELRAAARSYRDLAHP
jgi:hypothetical protein